MSAVQCTHGFGAGYLLFSMELCCVLWFWCILRQCTKSHACRTVGAHSENAPKLWDIVEVYGDVRLARTKTMGTLCCIHAKVQRGSVKPPLGKSLATVGELKFTQ